MTDPWAVVEVGADGSVVSASRAGRVLMRAVDPGFESDDRISSQLLAQLSGAAEAPGVASSVWLFRRDGEAAEVLALVQRVAGGRLSVQLIPDRLIDRAPSTGPWP